MILKIGKNSEIFLLKVMNKMLYLIHANKYLTEKNTISTYVIY